MFLQAKTRLLIAISVLPASGESQRCCDGHSEAVSASHSSHGGLGSFLWMMACYGFMVMVDIASLTGA